MSLAIAFLRFSAEFSSFSTLSRLSPIDVVEFLPGQFWTIATALFSNCSLLVVLAMAVEEVNETIQLMLTKLLNTGLY